MNVLHIDPNNINNNHIVIIFALLLFSVYINYAILFRFFLFFFYSLYISFVLELQSPTYCFVHVLFSNSSPPRTDWNKISNLCHVLSLCISFKSCKPKRKTKRDTTENADWKSKTVTYCVCRQQTSGDSDCLLNINNYNFCKILSSVQKNQQHEVAPCWSKNLLYVHIYTFYIFIYVYPMKDNLLCCRCKLKIEQ